MEIIFEDPTLLVLNKPSNIHSVMKSDAQGDSIAAWLTIRDSALAEVSPKPSDGGLVHRLDFETSGVIIAAKTKEAWSNLHSQMKSGAVKIYQALVEGALERNHVIETYIGSRYRGSKKVQVFREKRGRALEARTEIAPLRMSSPEATLVQATIRAGRRHQIRAHLASIGHPLVGDSLYGSKLLLKDMPFHSPHALPKFALHAERVTLHHPISGEEVSFSALLPWRLA